MSMSTDSNQTWLVEPNVFIKTVYDYLVIGGGTAGLALASRCDQYILSHGCNLRLLYSLAQDGKHKVGVIDAGVYRPDDPLINVPGVLRHF
jgi:hypothetical protein